MTLPGWNPWYRLGVANTRLANQYDFHQGILRLAPNNPGYYQSLVHSTVNWMGPGAASADWCAPPDNTVGASHILREVAAHDTQYGRRNISQATNFRFNNYIHDYSNQMFYVGNEPESDSPLGSNGCEKENWRPRNRDRDPDIAPLFDFSGDKGFYETWEQNVNRIKPRALAYVYLRLKRRAEGIGRGHVVLPPSTIGGELGFSGGYWEQFFDAVHSGVSPGYGSDVQRLTGVEDLRACLIRSCGRKTTEHQARHGDVDHRFATGR